MASSSHLLAVPAFQGLLSSSATSCARRDWRPQSEEPGKIRDSAANAILH
jgi:hypothetical protein